MSDFKLAESDKGFWVIARGFGPDATSAQEAKSVCEDVRFFVLRGIHDQDSTFPFVIRSYLSLPANVLFNAILYANHKLNARNKKLSIHDRVAVSVTVAFREGSRIAIANVGVGSAIKGEQTLVIPRSYANYLPESEREMRFHDLPLVALGMGKDDFEPEIVEYRLGEDDRVTLGMGCQKDLLQAV